MTTQHDYFLGLYIGGTFKRPPSISKNQIEHSVHGPTGGYLRQYLHLEAGRVQWLDDERFHITCRTCGR